MGDYSTLEWVSLALSVISLFGIASIWAVMRQLWIVRKRGRSIVKFKRSWIRGNPLSIVISTSENHTPVPGKLVAGSPSDGEAADPESNGPQYPRPTVSIWTTYAVSEISEVSSMLGYRKSFETDIAERLTHNQTGDLVLIGGRVKNIRSRQFSDHFNARHPELAIQRSPDSSSEMKKLKIGPEDFDFLPKKDKVTGHTVSDRAVLLLWRNPFSAGKKQRRGILCAGFTSMGTAGAAQYLSDSLQDGSLRRMWKAHRPRGWSYRRFPQFIVVLDVYINNDRYLDVYPIKFFPIIENGSTGRRFQIHGRNATVGHRWDADQHRKGQSQGALQQSRLDGPAT